MACSARRTVQNARHLVIQRRQSTASMRTTGQENGAAHGTHHFASSAGRGDVGRLVGVVSTKERREGEQIVTRVVVVVA